MSAAAARSLLAALVVFAGATPTTATTRSAAPAHVVVAPTFQFDIPAGELQHVIALFRAITGRTVLLPAGASLDGLPSPGVVGTFTADEALIRALEGTGIGFRKPDGVIYTLEVTVDSQIVEVTARAPYNDAVSTSATKTLMPLRDVPQSVTVITQQLIADQRMTGMADVLRYVPGAVMGQGEGNRDTPILRGNSTTADFFVDGVRDDVQYFRDLYNVERVEALKGPNAMMFGRGGAGGVINRSTRQADWGTSREATLVAGSFGGRRATVDVNQRVSDAVAARATGVYENSDSYRDGVGLQRHGFNPTFSFIVGDRAIVRAGYEYFHDERTADRGIPSFAGRPLATDTDTFFGDPKASRSDASVHALSTLVERPFAGGITFKNRTRLARYDKFYQNVYASGPVNAAGTTAPLGAYNNATERWNLFNQTDVTFAARTGSVHHRLLTGAEAGRQLTDNFRQTGYFTALGASATSMPVSILSPTVAPALEFRQSATDADNHITATVAAVYAQDEIQLTKHLQAIVGLRYDRFSVKALNHRTGVEFSSADNLVSPRVGLVLKPTEPLSLYTSYSVAYVPRAGDQLSSLTLSNQSLDPERFINYEAGIKWDVRPQFAVTAAAYRLNRTNVVIADPNDPSRVLLVDGQRTDGFEFGLSGNPLRAWTVVGGYAYQNGVITRTLSATAREGARLAHLPPHSFSLWNRYDISRRVGFGLGVIHTADMFAATDNTVTLPAFTRVDGALFLTLTSRLGAQLNVENVGDTRYYAFANGNNNITPGSPRSVRLSLTTRF
jgi:catecholate siderophore receptor